jgi:hypothetical protein
MWNASDNPDGPKLNDFWSGEDTRLSHFRNAFSVRVRHRLLEDPSSQIRPRECVCRGRFAEDSGHSCRNATIGSIFIARRAGKQQAATATAISNNDTTIKVNGSVGVTPNRRLEHA